MKRLHILCLSAGMATVPMWMAQAGADSNHSHSHYPPEATALVMPDITVDGDLSDWPPGMERHAIANDFGTYGSTDIDGVDLSHSDLPGIDGPLQRHIHSRVSMGSGPVPPTPH